MISPKVMNELHQAKLVPTQFTVPKPGEHAWSPTEQRRFWKAIQRFPQGPWTAIAAYVGSKSTRQAMTHAQKLRQKLNRWKRRVHRDSIGSNYSEVAPLMAPVEGYAGRNLSQSSVEDGKMRKLNYIENKNKGMFDCKPLDIVTDFKSEWQHFDCYDLVEDAQDDRCLEQLLSEIEPVLDHVAHFTNDSRDTKEVASATPGYDSEQALYFTHRGDTEGSKHTVLEHTWSQNLDLLKSALYQQQQSTPNSSSLLHCSSSQGGLQYNYIHQL